MEKKPDKKPAASEPKPTPNDVDAQIKAKFEPIAAELVETIKAAFPGVKVTDNSPGAQKKK